MRSSSWTPRGQPSGRQPPRSAPNAEIARSQQEVRNLVGQGDISARLIDKLPELAARMPEVQELKVLQLGQGDGAFDALPLFLAKLLAIAESMGVRLAPGRRDEREQDADLTRD